MIQQSSTNQRGFALPTILISSVVMIIVMLTAIQSVVSIRLALDNQYYDQLTREAAESGNIKARACLDLSGGAPTWTNASKLGPNTTCNGSVIAGASPYLFESKNSSGRTVLRTSFSVARPDVDASGKATNVNASAKIDLVRNSNGLPWKTSEAKLTATLIEPYTDDSLPLGTSLTGFWSTPPAGYLFEDGSAVSRTNYADLFALIGTTYGSGNGSTTFNLPDSRGLATVNKSTDAEFATVGQKYGEKNHTVTIGELPYHNHAQYVCANEGSPGIRRDYRNDVPSAAAYPQGVTTEAVGGNGAHNEVQPSIVKMSAVKFSKTDASISNVPAGMSISGYWSGTLPSGYLSEDGAAVSRATYATLFIAIGTAHGAGNGSTTFNLPDSRGRVAVARNTADTEFATIGQKYGTKTETLSIAQMPSHAHLQVVTANSGTPGVRRDWASDGACSAYPQNINTDAVGGGGAHNNIQASITKVSVIKQTAPSDTTNTTIVKPGTSINRFTTTVPTGYLVEDGSAVSRTTYAALFATIGTSYGAGNGSTTFNLPDSRGRVAVNKSSDTNFDQLGEKYGAKTHTLTIGEMPSHSHGQYVAHNNVGGPATRIDYASDGGSGAYAQGLPTGYNGGGTSHNNIQPSIVALSLIKT